MPPAKPRGLPEDASTSIKEKNTSTSTRGRRNGPSALINGSSLKDGLDASAVNGTGAHSVQNGGSGLSWSTENSQLLKDYRNAYGVDTPSALKHPAAEAIFSSRGIGMHSPTWARHKAQRRANKKQLALAVRKNFNALAVNETEVIVDLLYKVKMKDKALRVRFGPSRK